MKLQSRDKTIAALTKAAEERVASSGSAFAMLQQNISLEHVVQRKTTELKAQQEQLAATLAELRQTQSKLLQSQKMEAIGQLAAGIAHEINTPLQYVTDNTVFLRRAFDRLLSGVTACRGVLDLAEREQLRASDIKDARSVIARSKVDYLLQQVPRALEQTLEGLGRVTTIVRAMKEFSHPSSGERQPIDLAEAINTTLTVARSEWKYVADVTTEFDPTLPPVPCLRDELCGVLLNLIVNAAHAIQEVTDTSQRKGTIVVSTGRHENFAEIRVQDSGVGIPPAIQSRVFEPFFTTKPVGKGTGQGLSIAYSVVVEKHRGQIGFESQPGVGTTFYIRLPLSTGSDAAPRSS